MFGLVSDERFWKAYAEINPSAMWSFVQLGTKSRSSKFLRVPLPHRWSSCTEKH